MNNSLTNPLGIDVDIENIKNTLYDLLSASVQGDISAYGRVYRNEHSSDANSNAINPEWYNATKGDYVDVYYDDDYSLVFAFIENQQHKTKDENKFLAEVKVVFMLDLEKAYAGTEREDQKIQQDVIAILRDNAFERFEITGITKGIKNVFQGFETSGIRLSDTQPFHCFSVNLDLSYYINEQC